MHFDGTSKSQRSLNAEGGDRTGFSVGKRALLAEMEKAAEAFQVALPIFAAATEVWLMVGEREPNSWSLSNRFVLNAGHSR